MTVLDFKTIGLKIKERRQELGITQGTVSKSLNSSNALAYLGGVGMAARLIDERYGNGGNE